MGESTGGEPYERVLAEAYERFEEADDFTVSIEEEFALLDPETLDLVNRFEEVQAAARGTALEPNLVGELIASEVEVKTGKQASFAEVPAALAARRAQLAALVDPLGLALGATGTHPWASWRDQRIIDTPHYRRNDELLGYVVWRNNTFGVHTHVAIRGADRAVRVASAVRNWLPELLAVSASSPFHEGVDTTLHSARTQVFTRFFPRCGVPDALPSWAAYAEYVRFLYATGSVDEPTQLWWSVRPHLSFPTVEIRIYGALRACDRRGRAAAGPPAPLGRGEHVARNPLWPVRGVDRPRARRRAAGPRPGRAAARMGSAGRRGDRRGAMAPAPRAQRRRTTDRAARRGRELRGDLRRAGR